MEDIMTKINMCLSPDKSIRYQGELAFTNLEENEEFAIYLLKFIQTQHLSPHTQFAAVHLKNYIKRCWAPDEGLQFSMRIKQELKSSLFLLMMSTQTTISAELRECILEIASHDFPKKWPELIGLLQNGVSANYLQEPGVVVSSLETAHKLFKHYRYSFRSDELWLEIKMVVEHLFNPIYTLSKQLSSCLQIAQNEQEIDEHILALIPFMKVFTSLNSEDIPEPFDDTLQEWMGMFSYLMNFSHPVISNDTLLYALKGKVIKCLSLYAEKYDEDFEPYVENFCEVVWEMLARTSGQQDYDRFVSAALDFFRVVAFKPNIANLIHENLPVFFSSLILPNMVISEEEKDLAESSPKEFLKMFLEDANEETRRCACGHLMKALIRQFPNDLNHLITEKENEVLRAFEQNPEQTWKEMDAFILLLSGVFPVLYTAKNGATTISTSNEVILELYENLISPCLGFEGFPILKTSCLKYIYVYRNEFPRNMVLQILTQVAGFINNNSVILSSYAAATVERFLMIKEQEKVLLITKEIISRSVANLADYLVSALALHKSNTYLMKALFRVIWLAQETFSGFALTACDIFLGYINEVMQMPEESDPLFNWIVFESMALAVKSASGELEILEEKIEPCMAVIIQQSVPDLLPYAFQIQSMFMRLERCLNQTNSSLLESMLPLVNWESGSRYYAPTLVEFLEIVLVLNSSLLAGRIEELGGIIYELFTLGLDGQAFSLFSSVVETFPLEAVSPIFGNLYVIIFTKLHNAKSKQIRLSPSFHKGFALYVSSFVLRNGAVALSGSIEVVQEGIFSMLVKNELSQNLRCVDTPIERKQVAVALTNLLELPLEEEIWCSLFVSLVKMLEVEGNITSGTEYSNGLIDLPEENTIEMSRDSYERLYSCEDLPVDKLENIENEREYFLQTVVEYPYPSTLLGYVGPYLDEKCEQILYSYSTAYGIPLN